ncbi:MAG: hypothetical protein ACJ749_20510 [Flavisolibacter sp.]
MKKTFFSLFAATIVFGFVACNNSSDGATAAGDTTTAGGDTSATASAMNSTNDYSGFADDIEKNSAAGRYLNPKTGKPMKLKVNRTTGAVTNAETNEPVWRYVDNTNWWVYGLDDDYYWDKLGEARMESNKLQYKDSSDKWVDYDAMWKSNDETLSKTWKTNADGIKIKFGKDGDIKVKDKTGTTKYDASSDKIKTDSSHK